MGDNQHAISQRKGLDMATNPPTPPDPATGRAAEQAADTARRGATDALKGGTLDLAGLFAQADAEKGHHVLGHTHVKAALEALPNVSGAEAKKILTDAGIDPDAHIDTLTKAQEQALVAAVSQVK